MTRGFLPIALSLLLSAGTMPLAFAANDSQLNFKIYSPDGSSSAPAKADEAPAEPALTEEKASAAPVETTPADSVAPAETAATTEKSNDSTTSVTESKPELTKEEPTMSAPATTADTDTAPSPAATTADTTTTTSETSTTSAADTTGGEKTASEGGKDSKLLQGYVREVPAQTKIPIIMDTAVDSDTSQEGDEFAARTSEDLTIDGAIVVPAGSIIKGRIAQLNSPKHFNRTGSVALKFDTVTTPDNRQIPLVANLVAHGGVVHAKRGLKDYAIDSGTVAAPLIVGSLIGLVAGNSNNNNNNSSSNSDSGMSKGAAMALGAGVGLAVGVAILCAKKGKKVDVRPGDELKIELAEALRMPMM